MRPSPLLTLRSTTPKFGIGTGARGGRGSLLTPPSISPLGLNSPLAGGTPGEGGDAIGTPAGALLPVRENPHKLFIKTPPPSTTPAGGSSLTPATPATASPAGRGGVTPGVTPATAATGATTANGTAGGSGWRGASGSAAAPARAAAGGGGDGYAGGSSSKATRASPAAAAASPEIVPERTKASPAAAAAATNGHMNGSSSKPREGALANVPTLGRLVEDGYATIPSERDLEVRMGVRKVWDTGKGSNGMLGSLERDRWGSVARKRGWAAVTRHHLVLLCAIVGSVGDCAIVGSVGDACT